MKKILSILLAASLLFTSCKFLNLNDVEETDYNKSVSAVTFDTSSLTLKKGDSDYLTLSVNPLDNQSRCRVEWMYDSSFLSVTSDNFGAVITALKEGSTYIKAKCNGIIATCIITVSGISEIYVGEPYIYSNSSVVELHPGDTFTVSSSLYGGSIEDMEDFSWSVSDTTIADIDFSRNNCIITAKKSGSAKLVCSHPDARYDYTFIIYVYKDSFNEPYITTAKNIITIDKNETSLQNVTVSMINPPDPNYKNGFVWTIDDSSKDIISITPNYDSCNITPLKSGVARITVSHPDCQYDLQIIVPVISIVKNVFIELDTSTLIIDDSSPRTVNATLSNFDGQFSPDSFIWSVPEEANTLADCYSSGNSIRIQGKKNGSFKINVSNEYSAYSRNILVVLSHQTESAIDSTAYITTSQNYVQTKVGYDATEISVSLVGGVEGVDDIGDASTNFSWHIEGGRNNGIVNIEQVTGVIQSRAAVTSGNMCIGKLVITPLREGEVTISVTHPKCLYETDIVVRVYSESAIVNPKTLRISDSVIRLLNGSSAEVTAEVHNATSPSDEDAVTWSSADTSAVTVSPSTGSMTVVTATGSGSHQTYVTSHLDGALYDQKFLVLSADTSEELASMKFIYSDDSYLRLEYGGNKTVTVEGSGLSSSDVISWSSSDPSVCSVIPDFSSQNCSKASFTGNNAGSAVITASLDGCAPLSFTVTVLAQGESAEIFDENAGYLTTLKNAVVLEEAGKSVNLSVSGINIKPSDLELYTTWSVTDLTQSAEPCFEISGSGSNVTLTALNPGKSKIKVTNRYSSNELTINAKCGELYEWSDDYVVYIVSDKDVVNIRNGDMATVVCSLANSSSSGSFSWNVSEGSSLIDITGSANGTCIITAREAGQAVITVSSPQSADTKEILVNVANSEEELAGFAYLTTEQNVVTVGENSSASIAVNVVNSTATVLSGFSWRSSDVATAEIVSSGSTAIVYGKKTGTAKITVENYEYCSYPLEIIVNVVNQAIASSDPYISCNNIVACTVGSSYTTVSAELIGGTAADNMNFTWNVVDSNIATIVPSNDSVMVKAVASGVTQIVVSHPKASVPRTILVVCEEAQKTNCYISLSDSIIKMSPSDPVRTISATLVNGDASDVYDFKWWADDYQHINMNYTGATCLIEPLSSGTVTIHVSHPLVAGQKDIILYISQYTDFSFAETAVSVTTGHDMFVNMEVPASSSEYVVSYSSSNNSLCSAYGNNSVCTLHPGTLPDGYDSYTCTITATLKTKAGVKQGESQLLVSVVRKNETLPFIGLYPDSAPSVITLNKGEKTSISARLYAPKVDDTSDGLNWTINGADKIIDFVSSRNYGPSVQIQALNPGKTTITVSHNDDGGNMVMPFTIYVIVTGQADSELTLDTTNLVAVMGEDNVAVNARITNDTGEKPVWSCSDDSVFAFTDTGLKAYITPKAPGEADLICTLLSTNTVAMCHVTVKERSKLDFFYYDFEDSYTLSGTDITDDRRHKITSSTFITYPGEVRLLHYESYPVGEKLLSPLYISDTNYFTAIDKGYSKVITVLENGVEKTYHYPDNIGTIVITGKVNEGSGTLQGTSVTGKTATVTCVNGFNNMFRLGKSIISTTPAELYDNPELLYVDYELRPSCGKLVISSIDWSSCFDDYITLLNPEAVYDKTQHTWTISNHITDEETATSGVVRGTLKFAVYSSIDQNTGKPSASGVRGKSEVNATFEITAINDDIVSGTGIQQASSLIGSQNLTIKSCYDSHSFSVVSDSSLASVPYLSPSAGKALYSRYDDSSKCIIIGDGESFSGNITINELYSTVPISKVVFEPVSSCSEKGHFDISERNGNTENTHSFVIIHNFDYGYYKYKNNSNSWTYVNGSGVYTAENRLYPLKKFNNSSAGTEIRNDSVRLFEYAGNLVVTYCNFAKKKTDATFKIPVYIQIRNVPCTGLNILSNGNNCYSYLDYSEIQY